MAQNSDQKVAEVEGNEDDEEKEARKAFLAKLFTFSFNDCNSQQLREFINATEQYSGSLKINRDKPNDKVNVIERSKLVHGWLNASLPDWKNVSNELKKFILDLQVVSLSAIIGFVDEEEESGSSQSSVNSYKSNLSATCKFKSNADDDNDERMSQTSLVEFVNKWKPSKVKVDDDDVLSSLSSKCSLFDDVRTWTPLKITIPQKPIQEQLLTPIAEALTPTPANVKQRLSSTKPMPPERVFGQGSSGQSSSGHRPTFPRNSRGIKQVHYADETVDDDFDNLDPFENVELHENDPPYQ